MQDEHWRVLDDKCKIDGLLPASLYVTVAFMFLSYFFSNLWDGHDDFQEERWHIYETTCSGYLKILEKVASDIENK